MERSRANPRTVALLVLIVALVYILSIGPATVLSARFPEMERPTRWVYLPLDALPDPVKIHLLRYTYWWLDVTNTQYDT